MAVDMPRWEPRAIPCRSLLPNGAVPRQWWSSPGELALNRGRVPRSGCLRSVAIVLLDTDTVVVTRSPFLHVDR